MNASSLLLLLLLLLLVAIAASDWSAAAKKQEASPDDVGARIRGLWKVHMRESLLKGKGSGPHPARGGAKQLLLYCRVGIGFHLQILPGGAVGGVHRPSQFCWMRLFAVQRGVVGVQGVKSGLFLCLKEDGSAYGAERFSDDCLLKENLEENHYTTFSSHTHPGVYLALTHKGALKRGTTVGRHQVHTHFLPRRTP